MRLLLSSWRNLFGPTKTMPLVAAPPRPPQLLLITTLLMILFCLQASCFQALSSPLKPSSSSSSFLFIGTPYIVLHMHYPLSPRARRASRSRFPLFALNARDRLEQNTRNDDESDNGDMMMNDDASFPAALLSRRHFFAATTTAITSSLLFAPTLPAHAGALLQFPVGKETQVLKNKYHFMRAGLSDLEASGIYSTNALFLTNRENAMNVERGERMVLQALESFQQRSDREELFPTIAYHSLAANGMDTGDLIARELKLGREKLLPEFTYLDQRGVGLWDASDESLVKPAIWALDYTEAGKFGIAEKSRPPANNDGTPNETLGDQFVRLRQFLSLQESRTSGETILVIFPDGTGPALLSCMIAGIPFRDVHALEFRPGELRLDITPESVRALFEVRKDDPEYLATLQGGKEKLALLRKQQKEEGSNAFVGLKEQMAEKERLEIDEAFETKKKTDATRERERQRVVQEAFETKKKTDATREQERQRAVQAVQQAREEKERRRREAKERERHERVIAAAASAAALAEKSSSNSGSLDLRSSSIMAAAVGLLGLGAAVMATSGNDNKDENEKTAMETSATSVASRVKEGEKSPSLPRPATRTAETKSSLYAKTTPIYPRNEEQTPTVLLNGATNTCSSTTSSKFSLADEDMVVDESSSLVDSSDTVIQEQLDQLLAAEQAMKDALAAAGAASSSSSNSNNNHVDLVDNDTDEDGGDDAWLRVLSEIRDEGDDDKDDFFIKDAPPANTDVVAADTEVDLFNSKEIRNEQVANASDEDELFGINDAVAENNTAADFDLMMINGDGRKPSNRSADL